MEGVERAVQSACEALDILAGPLVTIVMIALMFGLVFLCAGLTVLVLWKSFSFGFRLAALKAWVKATEYLGTYFNRLRRFGLTRIASRIAVASGFVVWGEVPTPGLLAGSAMVIAWGMFLLWHETKRR